MPIQNYPRFLTKASKTAQQLQSGLPIVGADGVSGDFNALKVNTDGSINVAGGGGGDATASNQVTQINLATTGNGSLGTIVTNTTGIATASNQSTIITRLGTLSINSKWQTLASKSFNASSGTHTWNLQAFGGLYAVKLIFREAGIEITSLKDKTGTTVTSDYLETTGASIIVNAGTEVLSKGKSADDLFSELTTAGNCHFTAYYLTDPYITA
jgi:hypothetical protein